MSSAARHPAGRSFRAGPERPVTAPYARLGFGGDYRRFTENGMGREEQRSISRRLIRNAHESRLLHRMAGIRNVHKVDDVLAAAQDDGMLDPAIDAVIQNEHRTPGAVDPDSVGFLLCRHLLQAQLVS